MTIGIGIDAVAVEKCTDWLQKPAQLTRIFSEQEISYCFSTPHLTAQRLAARFAAREAFFKAVSNAGLLCTVPFLTLCKLVEVQQNTSGAPLLIVKWESIIKSTATVPYATCSLTHLPTIAIACVLISQSSS